MNREDTRRRIEVMQAFVDGKEIQARPYEGGIWSSVNFPEWKWHRNDYRIKPEPREGWVRISDLHHKVDFCDGNCIRVREVIE